MPRHTRLLRRDHRYYLRAKVPVDLQEAMGKKEIKWALKTSDPNEASKRIKLESAKADAIFERERAKLVQRIAREKKPLVALSEVQIMGLVTKWCVEMEEASEKEYDALYGRLEPHEAAEIRDNLRLEAVVYSGGSADFDAEDGSAELNSFLEREEITLERDSDSYRKLKGLFRRAKLANVERNMARLDGRPLDTAISMFGYGQAGAVPTVVTHAPASSKRLGELLDSFMGEQAKAGRAEATLRTYRTPVRLLREMLGNDMALSEITRERVMQLRDFLRVMPVNATQRFGGKPLEMAISEAELLHGVKRLGNKSVENYLHNIVAIFNYAVDMRWMSQNPASGRLLRDGFKAKRKNKVLFTINELNRIFRAPLYTGCVDDENGYAKVGARVMRRGRFWIPLLALWHGLRSNEACQLYTEDVREIEGVLCLKIRASLDENEDSEKRLKTEASERTIPVHPELLKIGFGAFVDRRRRDLENPRLFPELTPARTGYFSDKFQKWFGRFLESALGSKPSATFHSFRHLFRDALREADVSTERAEALGGWTSKRSAEALYGKGPSVAAMRDEIGKVAYKGLDLAHLHRGSVGAQKRQTRRRS
jgi:integrase